MSRTRITVDMIDADGCTFNRQYRYRILSFIRSYRAILAEFGRKPVFSEGEKALIDIFVTQALQYQKNLAPKKDEVPGLMEDSTKLAKAFFKNQLMQHDYDSVSADAELLQHSDSYLLNYYLYHHIQYMEKVCPEILRAIFISSNNQLIDRIIFHANRDDKAIVMLGSNRQSFVYDQVNMSDKGTASIYPELPNLVKYINASLKNNKVHLDKFTLADVYESGDFKSGRNYNKILKCTDDYVKNVFDNRKINIIYAACHHFAKKYPEAQISINLIDDQSPILVGLKSFYCKNPELLPQNVHLNLCKYDGNFSSSHTVSGNGVIDYNYEKNVRLMGTLCGYDPETNDVEVKMIEKLDVKKFMLERVTGWECVKYNENTQLTLFKKPKKQLTRRHIEPLPAMRQALL